MDDEVTWKPVKDKKEKIVLDGMEFDSREEVWFYWQLLEMKAAGMIREISRSESFTLAYPKTYTTRTLTEKGKVKSATRELIKGHSYTPDFKVVWEQNPKTEKILNRIHEEVNMGVLPLFTSLVNPQEAGWVTYFEVKPIAAGVHVRRGEVALAQANRKWLFAQKGIFVQLVYIGPSGGHFAKTFTPESFRLTDVTKKPRKLGYSPVIGLKEWLG